MPEGILIINKSPDCPSFRLVSILRRLTGVRKIGHAGTLDPSATGVMVMLIGKKYTKMATQFLHEDKEYKATIFLGEERDTYDREGAVISTETRLPSLEEIHAKISAHFQGEQWQTPPMFSAKKIQGKKLYHLARQGQTVQRQPQQVRLETTLISYHYPYLDLLIQCSKGTYIRTIAHDLGEQLQTGAYLHSLCRTRSGRFTLAQAVPQEALATLDWDRGIINL
jgi:tRNA pseudouridine55 synthase